MDKLKKLKPGKVNFKEFPVQDYMSTSRVLLALLGIVLMGFVLFCGISGLVTGYYDSIWIPILYIIIGGTFVTGSIIILWKWFQMNIKGRPRLALGDSGLIYFQYLNYIFLPWGDISHFELNEFTYRGYTNFFIVAHPKTPNSWPKLAFVVSNLDTQQTMLKKAGEYMQKCHHA